MTKTNETANLGKWGRLHYDYLYRNKRTVINAQLMCTTMNESQVHGDLFASVPVAPARGEEQAFNQIVYYGSGAFIVKIRRKYRREIACMLLKITPIFATL